ncbi:mitochondrial proton/calcium exchanger protein-like [Schistocerca gregaria]|uniref:mitochondrial proton/calcium exchanger protein-like n=1 Tax=Schistocerca gregaria TaxID=7010 RepID=UPI00211DBB31|nr:mitochondrial proton/calcium exchanger protein-like [Schistocerca gregaria]
MVVTNSPELKEFLEKLRTGGGVEIDEFVKYAKIFRDEVTLRSLQHRQLTAMCRLLNIKPFGNDAILRMRLKSRVESLKKDDQYILDEDINSLSLEELQRAVSARGMYSHTKNKRALRRPLAELAGPVCQQKCRLGVSALGRKADASFKLELLEEYSKLIEEEHRQVSNAQLSPDERRDNLVALANLANPVGLESLQIEELQATLSSLEKELSVHVSQVDDELKELEAELDSAKAEAYRRLLSERSAELKHLHKLKNRINDLVGELSADAAVAQKELNTFKLLDQNDDGLISEDEVKFALVSLPQPLTEDQVRRVLDQLDIDHDGLIELLPVLRDDETRELELEEAYVAVTSDRRRLREMLAFLSTHFRSASLPT